MCNICKDFYKTKLELQQHAEKCFVDGELSKDQLLSENVSLHDFISSWCRLTFELFQIKYHHIDPPMPIEKMRLMVTILLKKISSDQKLKELGFEKRKINVSFN